MEAPNMCPIGGVKIETPNFSPVEKQVHDEIIRKLLLEGKESDIQLPASGPITPGRVVHVQNQGVEGERHYSDNSHYIGQWANGKRNGLGIFTNSTGIKYIGYFLNDQMEQRGATVVHPNGNLLQTVVNEKEQRYDIVTQFADGTRYEGQHKDLEPHGQGILTLPETSPYEYYKGPFERGVPHGEGTLFPRDKNAKPIQAIYNKGFVTES